MKKRRLTPQEKKLLSYRKDCRNMVAESRSRSRVSIAKSRAMSHQAFRHRQNQIITELVKTYDDDFDLLINAEKALRTKSRRKFPDSPLVEFVSVLLRTRSAEGTNKNLKISEILEQAEALSPLEWRAFRWGITKKYFEEVVQPAIKRR